jgi:ABC-type lipoprotein release transport system permease subunit
MLSDSAIGVILGAIIGGIAGSILSFIVMQMPLTYLGLSAEVSWSRLPLVISVPFMLIVEILTLAALFSIVATYLVVRKGLQVNIAEDTQHSE